MASFFNRLEQLTIPGQHSSVLLSPQLNLHFGFTEAQPSDPLEQEQLTRVDSAVEATRQANTTGYYKPTPADMVASCFDQSSAHSSESVEPPSVEFSSLLESSSKSVTAEVVSANDEAVASDNPQVSLVDQTEPLEEPFKAFEAQQAEPTLRGLPKLADAAPKQGKARGALEASKQLETSNFQASEQLESSEDKAVSLETTTSISPFKPLLSKSSEKAFATQQDSKIASQPDPHTADSTQVLFEAGRQRAESSFVEPASALHQLQAKAAQPSSLANSREAVAALEQQGVETQTATSTSSAVAVPQIEIRIGRLELKAAEVPKQPKTQSNANHLPSLADYLRQ